VEVIIVKSLEPTSMLKTTVVRSLVKSTLVQQQCQVGGESGKGGASVQLAVVWDSGAGLGTVQDHPADTGTSHNRGSVIHSHAGLGYSHYNTDNTE